jgi:3-isopropylmalate/(R)-2-methylmalate dehydratase large subunit
MQQPQQVQPRTIFEKIWDRHVVQQEDDAPAVLYIDLHLVHEVTSPQAFAGLRTKGLKVRRPERTGLRQCSPDRNLSIPLADSGAAKPLPDQPGSALSTWKARSGSST